MKMLNIVLCGPDAHYSEEDVIEFARQLKRMGESGALAAAARESAKIIDIHSARTIQKD